MGIPRRIRHRLDRGERAGPAEWLRIHDLAHELGFQTNSTMLFGFGDTWAERVEHLLTLRQAQDRQPGFACFIPLSKQSLAIASSCRRS